jgi:hypothetical protein
MCFTGKTLATLCICFTAGDFLVDVTLTSFGSGVAATDFFCFSSWLTREGAGIALAAGKGAGLEGCALAVGEGFGDAAG